MNIKNTSNWWRSICCMWVTFFTILSWHHFFRICVVAQFVGMTKNTLFCSFAWIFVPRNAFNQVALICNRFENKKKKTRNMQKKWILSHAIWYHCRFCLFNLNHKATAKIWCQWLLRLVWLFHRKLMSHTQTQTHIDNVINFSSFYVLFAQYSVNLILPDTNSGKQ